MEKVKGKTIKKNNVNKSSKKTTKNNTTPSKRTNTKAIEKKKNTMKKGFTLIELLAVIIILGILMIIAIPSVTRYINDSRKSTYIDTAKEIISGTRNMVNEGNLEMFDTGTTYYIDVSCVKTENASKSPYGDFSKAYVVVTYNGSGYDYYWTSVDDAGQGIKDLVPLDKLKEDSISSDLTDNDISTQRGVDGRDNILMIDSNNNCQKSLTPTTATEFVTIDGIDTGPVRYPTGKTKTQLKITDIVKIGDQEFYFLKYDRDHIVLLAKYNLKVGGIYNTNHSKVRDYASTDEGYGLQCSECKGDNDNGSDLIRGTVPFSSTKYWTAAAGTYVYNESSSIYPYVQAYKEYIEELGVTVYEARLIDDKEFNLYTGGTISLIVSGSYWMGNVSSLSNSYLYRAIKTSFGWSGALQYNYSYHAGVRPVIVI